MRHHLFLSGNSILHSSRKEFPCPCRITLRGIFSRHTRQNSLQRRTLVLCIRHLIILLHSRKNRLFSRSRITGINNGVDSHTYSIPVLCPYGCIKKAIGKLRSQNDISLQGILENICQKKLSLLINGRIITLPILTASQEGDDKHCDEYAYEFSH